MVALSIFYFVGYPLYYLIIFISKKPEKKLNSILLSSSLGFGLYPMLLFYISFFGIKLTNRLLFLIIFLFIITSIFLILKSLIKEKKRIPKQGRNLYINNINHNSLNYLIAAIIILVVIFSFFYSLSKPIDTYDALFHWAYKAKILFYERTINSPSFNDIIYTLSRINTHPNYPLMVPLLEFHICNFLGKYDDRLIKVIFPFSFLLLIFIFYQYSSKIYGHNLGLLSTFFLVTVPFFYIQRPIAILIPGTRNTIFGGNAELPLVLFYFICIINIYSWIRTGHLFNMIIAAFFGGFAAFTKNDGLGLLITSFFFLPTFILVYFKGERKKRFLGFFVYLIISLVLIAPWLIHHAHLPQIDENYPQQLKMAVIFRNFNRIPIIIFNFFLEFINIKSWGLLWILFFVAIFWSRKKNKEIGFKFLLIIVLFQFALYAFIFIISPWKTEKLLSLDVLPRLLFQFLPIAILIILNIYYKNDLEKEASL